MSLAPSELPTSRRYSVTLTPALQLKVTVDEVNVDPLEPDDPGVGLSICAGVIELVVTVITFELPLVPAPL